jgi:anti-sigma regulatory factor (Ser/Thr protein kinase)
MTGTPRLELRLQAEPSSARQAREAVAKAATSLGARPAVVDDIRLCVSEVVTNAVRHAYLGEPGEVVVSCDRFRGGVLVVVRDFGLGTTPHAPRRHGEGGFGWKIVQSLADRYTVRSTPEDGTEVWMSFASAAERPERSRRRGPARARRPVEGRASGE